MSNLIERLNNEADLCSNETAEDIARLLDEAAGALEEAKTVIAVFAKHGNRPNDFAIPDEFMICQVWYWECKRASAWLEKWSEK